MIHADLLSPAVVNRLGFCDQLRLICCRQRDEFDTGFLGFDDLIIMLLPAQRTGLGDNVLLAVELGQWAVIDIDTSVGFFPEGVTDVVAVGNALNDRMGDVRKDIGLLSL
jgi:hypothetical protein